MAVAFWWGEPVGIGAICFCLAVLVLLLKHLCKVLICVKSFVVSHLSSLQSEFLIMVSGIDIFVNSLVILWL